MFPFSLYNVLQNFGHMKRPSKYIHRHTNTHIANRDISGS